MRNNNDEIVLAPIVCILILTAWVIGMSHIILWSVAETRKQTAETNKIVKEIIAEKK